MPTFDEDAEKFRLADFRFRLHERYFYEADAAPTWVASLTSSSRAVSRLFSSSSGMVSFVNNSMPQSV